MYNALGCRRERGREGERGMENILNNSKNIAFA
jgi:hypothetical protein